MKINIKKMNINHGLIVWQQPCLMKIIGGYVQTDPRIKYPEQNKRRLKNLKSLIYNRVYECPRCKVPMALFNEDWSGDVISYCGWGNNLTEEERIYRLEDCDQPTTYCDECVPIGDSDW